jgi:hypothetical protein
MLTAADLIRIPFTAELTQAGTAYLCRSLPEESRAEVSLTTEEMNRIVCRTAAELALRRLMDEQKVAYKLVTTTPFSQPENQDVLLGGRRCEVICTPVHQRERILQLQREPEKILSAPVLIPLHQINHDKYTSEDILIFAILTGLVAQGTQEIQKALTAGHPVDLLAVLPPPWRNSFHWKSLGSLSLKSEASEAVRIELGGLAKNRKSIREELVLQPLTRTQVQGDYYSLTYLRLKQMVEGRIGIHSTALHQTHILGPHEWLNIWVYGMSVILCGYISLGEYRRKANSLPPESQIFYHSRLRMPQLWLPVSELNPISSLFLNAKNWQCKANAP